MLNTNELLRQAMKPTIDMILGLENKVSRALRPVLAEIRERFCEPELRVADLKKALGLTDNWLMSAFRQEVGMTPWQFIKACRLETALRLLRDTALSVADVSSLVGYQSLRHFRRLLVNGCGMTASQYRKHARRARPRTRRLPPGVSGVFFFERFRRRELSADEVRAVLMHLADLKAAYEGEIPTGQAGSGDLPDKKF